MNDPIYQLNRLRSQRACGARKLLCNPRYIILSEVEGYHFQNLPITPEGCARGIFHGGDTHVRVLLPEYLCNRLPGFRALVIREDTPTPLLVG